MDKKELAQNMLEWQELKERLDALESKIVDAVLAEGKSIVVGEVRATYVNPRKKYDYETAVTNWIDDTEVLAAAKLEHSKQVVDWNGICKDYDIDDIPFELQGQPSVRLKIQK